MSITNRPLDTTKLSVLIANKVKDNLTFSVKNYPAFTPENLEEIGECVKRLISACGAFSSIEDQCRSIEDGGRVVIELVAGKRTTDANNQVRLTGLSEMVYKRSSTNIFSRSSYYHFSLQEFHRMSCTNMLKKALDHDTKKK